MKKKELNELRNKSITDLRKMAGELKLASIKKKLEISSGKDKNLKSFKTSRLEVAKILTLAREKEIIEKLEESNKKTAVKVEKVTTK